MAQEFVSLWIGGPAGAGGIQLGEAFLRACARCGLNIHAYNSRQGLLHGGHELFQVVAAPEKVHALSDSCDFLIALDAEAFRREAKDALFGVLYDAGQVSADPAACARGAKPLGVPAASLAGDDALSGEVLLGALARVVGLPWELLEGVLEVPRLRLGHARGPAMRAARAGFDYGASLPETPVRLARAGPPKIALSGYEALALGALAAGCKFAAGAADCGLLLELEPRAGAHAMELLRGRDPLACARAALGAAHAGVRALAVVEGEGLDSALAAAAEAAVSETPLVLVAVQRAGPAAGLPAKSGQGGLLHAVVGSQGDYPRVVLAPTDVADAFSAAAQAFELAEKFQIPALVLADTYLAERWESADSLDFNFSSERGAWARPRPQGASEAFARYRDSEDGVSPRAIPGQEGLAFTASVVEHAEDGTFLSGVGADAHARVRMVNKRLRKLDFIARGLPETRLEGPRNADITLVGWGSSCAVLRLVLDKFNLGGMARVNLLELRQLWPFPFEQVAQNLYPARRVLAVESSPTGQLCRLIRMETGFYVRDRWLQYDGEPFYPGSTFAKVQEVLWNA